MRHLRISIFAAIVFASAALLAQDANPNSAPSPSTLTAATQYTALKSGSLWDILLRGGPFIWPVLLAGAVGFAFVIDSLIELNVRKHSPKDFAKDIVHVVDSRGVDAGLARCLEKRSSIGRVMYAALLRHGTSRQEMESAVADESTRVLYDLRRATRPIGVASLIALFLGFLGTSIGGIEALDRIALSSAPDASNVLAGNLAEALLPTAIALFVATLLAILYFYLKGRASDIVREITEKAIEGVVTLDRKARQSIRLIEDIEEQTKTKDMNALKHLPPDLAREIEIDRSQGSGIKSSITTHAGLPVQKPESSTDLK